MPANAYARETCACETDKLYARRIYVRRVRIGRAERIFLHTTERYLPRNDANDGARREYRLLPTVF